MIVLGYLFVGNVWLFVGRQDGSLLGRGEGLHRDHEVTAGE